MWLRRHLGLLVVLDAGAALGATLLAQLLTVGSGFVELEIRGVGIPYALTAVAILPAWLGVLASSGCYDVGPFGIPHELVRRVIGAGARFLALMAVAYYVVHLEQLGRDFMIAIGPLATVLTLVGRTAGQAHLRFQRNRGHAIRRALIIGRRPQCEHLLDHLAHDPHSGIVPVAVIGPDHDDTHHRVNGYEIPYMAASCTPDEVLEAVDAADADLLLLASGLATGDLRALTWQLEGSGIDVLVAPTVPQLMGPWLDIRPLAGLPLLYVDRASLNPRN